MVLDFSPLKPAQIYHTMTQVLIPRPIAWILSLNEDDTHNLAPFSYFSGVCSQPPLISVSIGKKKDGQLKDTRKNILERKTFVIHIPSLEQAQEVTDSAKVYEYGHSELSALNLETQTIEGFTLPVLTNASIALECEYYQHFEVGDIEQALILGKIERLYAKDDLVQEQDERLSYPALDINPLARLGGKEYAGLNKNFEIEASK